jgi:hypothetical protein
MSSPSTPGHQWRRTHIAVHELHPSPRTPLETTTARQRPAEGGMITLPLLTLLAHVVSTSRPTRTTQATARKPLDP